MHSEPATRSAILKSRGRQQWGGSSIRSDALCRYVLSRYALTATGVPPPRFDTFTMQGRAAWQLICPPHDASSPVPHLRDPPQAIISAGQPTTGRNWQAATTERSSSSPGHGACQECDAAPVFCCSPNTRGHGSVMHERQSLQ